MLSYDYAHITADRELLLPSQTKVLFTKLRGGEVNIWHLIRVGGNGGFTKGWLGLIIVITLSNCIDVTLVPLGTTVVSATYIDMSSMER